MSERVKRWTPGPWHSDCHGFVGAAPGGDDIVSGTSLKNNGETEANGRLIAAAPALVEALEAAIDCGMVPRSSATNGGASKYSHQVKVADQIRAALALAYGETQ